LLDIYKDVHLFLFFEGEAKKNLLNFSFKRSEYKMKGGKKEEKEQRWKFIRRSDRLTMGYFDNFDNDFLNKYKKN
jgi:hypothetical protein